MPLKERVVFRKYRNGDIIAYLLDQPEYRPGTCQSYMHVGQHGAADYFDPSTVLATPEEYADLKREMEEIYGYRFRVVQRGRISKYYSPVG